MENTTITRSFDFTLETIDFIISQFDQLDEIQRVMGVGRTLEEQSTYDHLRQTLLDASADINRQIEEESNPKYEHRWAIKTCNGEVIEEFDSLEDAFEGYTNCYKDDWAEGGFNEGEYSLFDNELQVELTSKAPTFSVEYNWDANINVECDGTSIYTEDTPDEVMESIRDEFYNGDDYGTYTYQYDGIYYGHVKNALEKAEEERRNANAEEERA